VVPTTPARCRLYSRREVERRLVDDEPNPTGIEGGHDRSHRRHVEFAGGPTADHVDLGFAGSIDVGDGPEELPVRPSHLGPDHLVPPGLAGFELGVPVHGNFEVDGPQALRRGPVVDLLEPEPPAGTVLDGRGRFDRQGGVTAFAMQDLADRESILGAIREDFDANEALQAMGAADPPDDDPSRLAQRDPLRGSRA